MASADDRSADHDARPETERHTPIDDAETCVRLTIASYDEGAGGFRERFYGKGRIGDENRDVMGGVALFVLQLLRRRSHPTVLDLGCGPGEHGHFMGRATKATVVGVDRSEGMLRLARDRFEKIRLARMDVRTLGFANESFDAILASFIVNHVPVSHASGFFREVWRVARPHCALYIIANENVKTDSSKPAGDEDPPLRVMYTLPYTADELSAHVTRAGFHVSRLLRSAGGRLHLMAVKPPVPAGARSGVDHD